MFFGWIFENNCPGGGVLVRFFCPRGRGFALSLCRGGGIRPFKKVPQGEWSGLELTDTLLSDYLIKSGEFSVRNPKRLCKRYYQIKKQEES